MLHLGGQRSEVWSSPECCSCSCDLHPLLMNPHSALRVWEPPDVLPSIQLKEPKIKAAWKEMTLFPTVLWLLIEETLHLPSLLWACVSSCPGQGDLSKHSSCANSVFTVTPGYGRGRRNCFSFLGYTGGN